MKTQGPLLVLTLRSELRLLRLLRRAVEEAALLAGFDHDPASQLVLAVNEASANIIQHAHRQRCELTFTVSFSLEPDGIEVHLCDQGDPFDFQAVAELDPTEIRRGGRGVYLIRRLIDRISIEHPPSGGNILRLFKRQNHEEQNHEDKKS